MISNSKRQHYIWQHYLKAWTINNKVWCKRNGKIFNTSTVNIAQETFFYESKILNTIEIKFIRDLISSMHPSAHSILNENLDVYIATANGDDSMRKNGIEKLHSIFEDRAAHIFNDLRDGDLSILDNDDNKIEFCKFLGRQYTRTKKMISNKVYIPQNIAIPKDLEGQCDFQKVFEVMNFILSENIGNWSYTTGIFSLLKAPEGIDFITCDQPISNIDSINNSVPASMTLFYPLSPKVALIISKDKIEKVFLTASEINSYNDYLKNISYEITFALDKSSL